MSYAKQIGVEAIGQRLDEPGHDYARSGLAIPAVRRLDRADLNGHALT
jgi:hypothetical protein